MSGIDPNGGGALVVPGGGGASLSDATPAAPGTAAAGTGTSASRDDHVHTPTTAAQAGAVATSVLTTEGDTFYRNATVPARLAKGAAGQRYRQNAAETAPEWADPDIVCTVAELATTYAPSAVLRGVIAYTTDALATYVCRRTAASTYAWALQAAGATAADARTAIAAAYDPGARAIDASTIYVWRCDDAAGAGTIAEASGGPAMTLTGSTWVQGDGGLYRGGRALHLTAGAVGTDRATSGTITAPSGSLTIELDFSIAITHGITFGTSQTAIIGLNNGGTGNYVYLRLSWSAGATAFMGGWKPDGSAEQSTPTTLLGSAVVAAVPHHAMLSITKGSGSANGTMSLYLDGTLVGTTSSIRDASLLAAGGTWVAVICNAANNLAPLMRCGEVRISNVARDAAYARAAYATLIARH